MTLTLAWWLYDKQYKAEKHSITRRGKPASPTTVALSNYAFGLAAVRVAGAPYDYFIRGAQRLRDIDYWSDMARGNRAAHQYMVKHGMPISKASAKAFAATSGTFVPGTARYAGSAGVRIMRGRGARLAVKLGARFVPGLGWALLAYDVYTVSKMILD